MTMKSGSSRKEHEKAKPLDKEQFVERRAAGDDYKEGITVTIGGGGEVNAGLFDTAIEAAAAVVLTFQAADSTFYHSNKKNPNTACAMADAQEEKILEDYAQTWGWNVKKLRKAMDKVRVEVCARLLAHEWDNYMIFPNHIYRHMTKEEAKKAEDLSLEYAKGKKEFLKKK